MSRSRSTGLLFGEGDPDRIISDTTEFIRTRVETTDQECAVVWLDAQVSSMVTAMLAVDALGAENVVGLASHDFSDHLDDVGGRTIASGLGVEYCDVPLRTFRDRFEDAIATRLSDEDGAQPAERAKSRLGMVCAYYVADIRDGVVLGSLDRTRWLLGTGPRHGYEYGDVLPLGHLYTTEVGVLADHLGVPIASFDFTTDPVGTIGDNLSLGIEQMDRLLYELVDQDESIEDVARTLDLSIDTVRACARRHAMTEYTRTAPAIPGSDGDDEPFFHELELRFE